MAVPPGPPDGLPAPLPRGRPRRLRPPRFAACRVPSPHGGGPAGERRPDPRPRAGHAGSRADAGTAIPRGRALIRGGQERSPRIGPRAARNRRLRGAQHGPDPVGIQILGCNCAADSVQPIDGYVFGQVHPLSDLGTSHRGYGLLHRLASASSQRVEGALYGQPIAGLRLRSMCRRVFPNGQSTLFDALGG